MSELDDIQKEMEKARKTLEDAKKILDQLDKPRSVYCEIYNLTDQPLTFAGSHHDHGGYAVIPKPVIPPHSAINFGSQSKAGSLFTGTEGYVDYVGAGGAFRFYWDNPWLGSNGSDATLTAGKPEDFNIYSQTGAGDHAQMQFVVYQRPVVQVAPPPPKSPPKHISQFPAGSTFGSGSGSRAAPTGAKIRSATI